MKAAELFDLTGKVAFVTGAAQGLGREMAQVLADNGAILWLFDRDDDKLEQTARDLRDGGASVTAITGDVTDDAALRAAVAGIVARHGRLDICIANAGITDAFPGLIHDLQDDDWGAGSGRQPDRHDADLPCRPGADAAARLGQGDHGRVDVGSGGPGGGLSTTGGCGVKGRDCQPDAGNGAALCDRQHSGERAVPRHHPDPRPPARPCRRRGLYPHGPLGPSA